VTVRNLSTLRDGLHGLFAKQAPRAVAVKTQHAYERTLTWRARDEADIERVLQKALGGDSLDAEEKLCIGDWCLGQAAELAAVYDIPVKIHCGYYAGNNRMPMDWIHASNLCGLLAAYPLTRFVLMHTAYPYGGEVVALAKHYANVYVDMCWAWSVDPHTSESFLRQFLHAAPANKLFIFGGDSFWPQDSAAYAWQARRGLSRALRAEVESGFVNEAQAVGLADRWMRRNAYACFDVARAQAA
jgi:predicted TIM-barrel fold metal-dependent hydrolase